MPLSKRDLIQLCSAAVYSRGETYFRQNRVSILKTWESDVLAQVRGGSHDASYQVFLSFSDDGSALRGSRCDCPAYRQYEGICKHIVAAVLAFQQLAVTSAAPAPRVSRSDSGARLLLQTYVQAIADQAGESYRGQARLEPVLEYDDKNQASLFFRIGEQRMYVVRDLGQLHASFRSHATVSYGKQFTLWHGLPAFRAESRPMVRFFCRRYDAYNYLHNPADQYRYYGYSGQKRNMYLSPVMADEFFALLDGKQLTTRDSAKRDRSAVVVTQDYRPHLRLTQTQGGAVLAAEDWYLLLPGDKGLHVFTGDKVYRCGGDFAAACGELLRMLQTPGRRLFFAESDLGILFSAVLPKVEPFVRLTREGDFEQHQPLPLETKIYLDSPRPDSVTARMVFAYGERQFPAFGEKDAVTSHDIAGELVAENLLLQYMGGAMDPDGTLWVEDDPDRIFRLLSQGLEPLSQVGALYASDAFGKVKIRPPAGVSVGVRVEGALLQLDFDLDGLNPEELPQVLASYRLRKTYHRLRDGSFLLLEETALAGLAQLAHGLGLTEQQLVAGQAELPASRALYLDAVCKQQEALRVQRDSGYKKMLRDMAGVEHADFPVPEELRKTLRNYQKTGFRWLKTMAAYGFGGILADDMGLGKTLQVLALLESCRREPGEQLPSLVVCPSSLCLNWESEAQKFTPGLRVAVIGGAAPERAALIARAGDFDLLLTSYDQLKRDIPLYRDWMFRFVVIDEAQYIKNQGTQNAKSVKALRSRARFALTGTPVENSLADLWSIFDFLLPGYLFSYRQFKQTFEEPMVKDGDRDVSERLRQLVQPFLLRRLKQDVLRELPPKTETVLRSAMEEEQRKVYAASLAGLRDQLKQRAGAAAGQERIVILAALTRLRQICCDPALLYENYHGGSAKLEACMELVDSCVRGGRRILLFSQFTSMLDRIEPRLAALGVDWLRIDGSTKSSRRLALVNQFNSGTVPVFLISLKAGGTGLNLTGADVVIHYDPWWNISAQNQATDRAHRIGQKNRVQVYKLIVKDTIEERILVMQEKKAALADQVVEANADPLARLNREELLALLEG